MTKVAEQCRNEGECIIEGDVAHRVRDNVSQFHNSCLKSEFASPSE